MKGSKGTQGESGTGVISANQIEVMENALNPCVIELDWRRENMDVLGRASFPGGSDGKDSACNAGDLDSISGSGRPLEKEMGTHSSILAWRIPWTEEPSGLQSMGS